MSDDVKPRKKYKNPAEQQTPAQKIEKIMQKKENRVRLREDKDASIDNDNRKYLRHSMRFFNLPLVDLNNVQDVHDRIALYFNACDEDEMKPTLVGLCVALGISRQYFYKIREGMSPYSKEVVDTLKRTSDILNAQMENYMQNGKINPVSGIFLMKNHYHYTDEQKVVVEPNQNLGDSIEQKALEDKYKEALPDIETSAEEQEE